MHSHHSRTTWPADHCRSATSLPQLASHQLSSEHSSSVGPTLWLLLSSTAMNTGNDAQLLHSCVTTQSTTAGCAATANGRADNQGRPPPSIALPLLRHCPSQGHQPMIAAVRRTFTSPL
ncbi:hypothetical protein BHE74_00058554 [Ensete ventricosum]|nr:hypothetical protein GW17_00010085 [Ensete ventricosum]RWW36425.1 hypothetical protein BHE74_00058554 [Ensete ventricosum]RZR94296.1 hypothetical protein BHM03_00022973 [Ensete ventricosum]